MIGFGRRTRVQEAPDGIYTLDLAYHDERMFAQILVRLAFVEPGENWEDATYKDIEGQGLISVLIVYPRV